MKKKQKFLLAFILSMAGLISFSLGVGCRNLPAPASPAPAASTPTCVWTPLPGHASLQGNISGTYVIRNASDWAANMFPYPTTIPTPAPPVDLSQWMLVGVTDEFSCSFESKEIYSVCAYSDHIEVVYGPAPIVVPTPGIPIAYCNYIAWGTLLAAIPQSNLPVVFTPIVFNITPTPTP